MTRTLTLAFAVLFIGLSATAQKTTLEKFCEKYKDCDMMAGMSSDLAGASMLGSMVHATDTTGRANLMKKIQGMRLLTFDDPEHTPNVKEWKALVKGLRRDHFEEMFSASQDHTGMGVYVATLSDGTREMVMLAQGDDAFLLDMKGPFSDEDVASMKLSMHSDGKNVVH